MAPISDLFIIYNANASLLGKLNYSYRKITCSKSDDPACAACDITHGGLHLDETAEWKEAKAEIAERGVNVKQLHRDELDDNLKQWMKTNMPAYPLVLARRKDAEEKNLELIMNNKDLAGLGGKPKHFVEALRSRELF